MKPRRCRTCHFRPCRCQDLAAGEMGQSNTPSCWPMRSLALAVHPSQVEAANARAKRHGICVEYDRTGRCHIPDRANRKKLLRLEGFHDNNGGYGD